MREEDFQVTSLRPETISLNIFDRGTECARTWAIAGFMLDEWLQESRLLPGIAMMIPDLSEDEPEIAATVLRRMWRLGNANICSVTRCLEAKGVRVLALPSREIHSPCFCAWHDGRAFIFIDPSLDGLRRRFLLACCLGRFVLHPSSIIPRASSDAQAEAFASEFLVTTERLIAAGPKLLDAQGLHAFSAEVGIPATELLQRLSKTRKVPLMNGTEINSPPLAPASWEHAERPALWATIFQRMKTRGISTARIAKGLGVPTKYVNTLMFKFENRPILDLVR